MPRIRMKSSLFGLCAALVSVASSAADSTSVVYDVSGDAAVTGQGTAVAPYQDITAVSVTSIDGKFVFVMDLAAALPSRPPMPHGAKLIEWSFRLNTDLGTCPSGYPYANGATLASPEATHCAEYLVFIVSDGSGFTGMLIDRTPALTGGNAVVTPIPFSIVGAEITAWVNAAAVKNPASFRWTTRTETWFSELGSMGYVIVDAAPDEGFFATWPSH